jgi:hypothetical protein
VLLVSHPWPWINLNETNDERDLNCDAPTTLGSCGHDDCEDCKQWTSYPQSLFGNWTIEPVKKCGIERAVKGREHSSTIYWADVLDSGVFKGSGKHEVSTGNKREFWRDVLATEVNGRTLKLLCHLNSILFYSANLASA